MKKPLFALLALVLLLVGCPSGPVDVGVDAQTFAPASTVDGAVSDDAAAPHRLGSFNPTCTGSGFPIIVSGVQQTSCATLGSGVGAWLANPTGGNLASALTTALPVSKGGTNRTALGTGLQVLRTNAGATDTEWATVSGGGSSAGATSGQVQTGDGAGGFLAPSNVLAGSGFLSVGASPTGVAGALRIGYSAGTTQVLTVSDAGGTNSRTIAKTSADTTTTFGDISLTTIVNGAGTQIHTNSGTSAGIYIDPNYGVVVDGAKVAIAYPILGDSNMPSPWSVHGKTTVATTGSFSLAAADYAKDAIMLSGGTAGTVTFPTPADDAHAYYKTIINTSGVTKTLTDGGASTPTLATALTGHYLFDLAGVHLTGPSVAYP